LSDRIAWLFEVLNMPEETRVKRTLLSDELKQFRYINGGLFTDRLPPELLSAHKELDRAVMKLYGFAKDAPEPAIVAALMERYQRFV